MVSNAILEHHVLNIDLFYKVIGHIEEYIKENTIKLSVEELLCITKETYVFSTQNDNEISIPFIKWLMKNKSRVIQQTSIY